MELNGCAKSSDGTASWCVEPQPLDETSADAHLAARREQLIAHYQSAEESAQSMGRRTEPAEAFVGWGAAYATEAGALLVFGVASYAAAYFYEKGQKSPLPEQAPARPTIIPGVVKITKPGESSERDPVDVIAKNESRKPFYFQQGPSTTEVPPGHLTPITASTAESNQTKKPGEGAAREARESDKAKDKKEAPPNPYEIQKVLEQATNKLQSQARSISKVGSKEELNTLVQSWQDTHAKLQQSINAYKKAFPNASFLNESGTHYMAAARAARVAADGRRAELDLGPGRPSSGRYAPPHASEPASAPGSATTATPPSTAELKAAWQQKLRSLQDLASQLYRFDFQTQFEYAISEADRALWDVQTADTSDPDLRSVGDRLQQVATSLREQAQQGLHQANQRVEDIQRTQREASSPSAQYLRRANAMEELANVLIPKIDDPAALRRHLSEALVTHREITRLTGDLVRRSTFMSDLERTQQLDALGALRDSTNRVEASANGRLSELNAASSASARADTTPQQARATRPSASDFSPEVRQRWKQWHDDLKTLSPTVRKTMTRDDAEGLADSAKRALAETEPAAKALMPARGVPYDQELADTVTPLRRIAEHVIRTVEERFPRSNQTN